MKKTILALSCLTLLSGVFSSCKKGENDPFLSLKSRKARVVGEWKISKLEETGTSTDFGESYQFTHSNDGSTTIYTHNPGGETKTTSFPHSESYAFKKDGTYTINFEESLVEDDITYDYHWIQEGTWTFLRKSKEGNLKNKEAILLSRTKSTFVNIDDVPTMSSYQGMVWERIIVLDQLKTKEIQFMEEYTQVRDGENYTSTIRTTLSAQ
jgi:hypothetical protein